MKNYKSFIMSCTVLAFAGSASAANVVWNTVQTVTAATDIDTTGTLAYARGFASSSTTVNGVTFDGTSNYSDTFDSTFTGFLNGLSFIGTNDSEGQSYATLLDSGRYFQAGSTSTNITLSNLTIGQNYLVQFLVADYRTFPIPDRTQTITGGSNTSGQLSYLDGNDPNGNIFASYVIGNFTTDGVSQTFNLLSNQDTLINAVQLRNIPEPSAALLGGLAALAFLRRRRA